MLYNFSPCFPPSFVQLSKVFFYLIFSGLRDNVLRFLYAYGILALVSVVAVSYGMFYLYGTAQQICVVDTDSVATVCNYFWLMFNIEA